MILIDYIIKPSQLGGLGIFSNQLVNVGQIVWKNNSDSEMIISAEKFDVCSEYLKSIFRRYGYKTKGRDEWRLPLDDSRFFNHSLNPSIVENENGDYISISQINVGDEVTCNYKEFDDGCGDFIF
jgi:hypothetical protein